MSPTRSLIVRNVGTIEISKRATIEEVLFWRKLNWRGPATEINSNERAKAGIIAGGFFRLISIDRPESPLNEYRRNRVAD